MKKFFNFFLIAVLCFTLFQGIPFSVSAENSHYNYVVKNILYNISDNEVHIYSLQSLSGDIVLPAKIEGYPVTSIDFEACYENSSITSIVIPEGVKSIGGSAFEKCKKLSKISLPNSIESIGYAAFDGTAYYNKTSSWHNDILYVGNHLIKAEKYISGTCKVKEGTITIADSAFRECEEITKITLPKSLKNISVDAFTNCSMLESISVSKDSKYFSSKDGVLFNKNKTELVVAPCCLSGSYTIPNSVKVIGAEAFNTCDMVTSITIPNSVKEIGHYAFRNCYSLKKINIPDSVTKISTSILFGSKYYNTESNWEKNLLYVGNHLVDSKKAETESEYVIKHGTKTIAANTFSSCHQYIEKITLPDSLTHIGNAAFSTCYKLTSIVIPKNVKVIGGGTFSACTALKSIELPESLQEIGRGAFSECTELESINLPQGLTEIADGTFRECYDLESIEIPKNVKIIGDKAFESCRSLKSITIPKKVESIGEEAFSWCKKIKKITLYNNVKTIEKAAFYNCSKISAVYYKGSKADRQNISIAKDNDYFINATWKYDPPKNTPPKNDTPSQKPAESKPKEEETPSVEETVSSEPTQSEEVTTSSTETSTPTESNVKTNESTENKKSSPIWIPISVLGVLVVAGAVFVILKTKKKT